MTKLILSCILCCSTLMISNELHRRKVRLADTVADLAEAISRMITMLRFEAADVYTLCREAFTDSFPAFRGISSDFPSQWQGACKTIQADSETERLILLAGETIGASDALSQCERLTLIRDDLRSHAESLKQKAMESKKLYTTLGAAAGFAAAIIMI